jgi:hypothetical protein
MNAKIQNRLRLAQDQLDRLGSVRFEKQAEALEVLTELDESVGECIARIRRKAGLARGTGPTQETLGNG